jgi:DNA-binding NtrC family response regulator
MRILLIEDDDILRDLLTQRLSEHHYAIDTARDGLQGWEYATTYEYDLLILDVVLPQLDGLTTPGGLYLAHFDVDISRYQHRQDHGFRCRGRRLCGETL